MSEFLFDKGSPADKASVAPAEPIETGGTPRLRVPIRNQVAWGCKSLDQQVEPEHPVRIVWAVVCGWNLSRWSKAIKAVEGHVGRNATDPRLLVALWGYATLEGVGSARDLAKLCQDHCAYEWLCGGVSVNHHLLSDFRSHNATAWDELLTQIVGSLLSQDLVSMKREASAAKSCREPREARASTTDPEARTMQFSDGGYRPGYNVHFATDVESGVVLGVEVVNAGTDAEQLPPMLTQLRQRYGRVPEEALVDGGFASRAAIRKATDEGCTVYAPLKQAAEQLAAGKDPYAPKPGDDAAMIAWRQRMGTEAAKQLYRLRGQTAEWVNAGCRNRGLWQLPVRGRAKGRIIALLHAITHNLWQAVKLRSALSCL